MTKNAQLIFDIVAVPRRHLTTEEIYLKVKSLRSTMVLATVYNNLNALLAEGLIRKVSVEGYPDRYDRAEKHDHLVCENCGNLTDIMLDDLTPKLQSQVESEIYSYDLKINHTCPQCRNVKHGLSY